MVYEPPNRGGKTITALNRGVGGNDPGSVTDPTSFLANSFLMPQGYSMSFSGWDLSAGTSAANFNTTITLPIAKNPDGSSITGPVLRIHRERRALPTRSPIRPRRSINRKPP